MPLRVFEHKGTLPRGNGEIGGEKIRRKSQREAARLQEQADALLAMEEDEEVHFKRPVTVPDTPPVSRANSPEREEEDDREVKDYTTVLEMVKAVRELP